MASPSYIIIECMLFKRIIKCVTSFLYTHAFINLFHDFSDVCAHASLMYRRGCYCHQQVKVSMWFSKLFQAFLFNCRASSKHRHSSIECLWSKCVCYLMGEIIAHSLCKG